MRFIQAGIIIEVINYYEQNVRLFRYLRMYVSRHTEDQNCYCKQGYFHGSMGLRQFFADQYAALFAI